MFALLVIQIHTGLLSGYRKDQGAYLLAVGFRSVADEIEMIRSRVGATCVLASDYGTTAWFAFYPPKGTCVAQRGERIRWANMPEPDPTMLKGKLLFAATNLSAARFQLATSFYSVNTVAELSRIRGPSVIQTYEVVLLEGAKGEVFARSLPLELVIR
jgi:hypothetical protein